MASGVRKGTIIDERYKLLEKIGTGGMADVWLADDVELERDVAIKILHDRYAEDLDFVERFRREAQSAAGLQHPNVVSVFDRGEFKDTYFIAMEYVDGPSLKDLVRGGMGTQDAVDFTRQILSAARFAHRKGIIHRDLKPQNVLIDDDGRARVADFGIARGMNSDITQTGSVMGTAAYLPPEQAQGRESTPQSDIYSIGVILYEALTGQVPFEADSAVAVALKQVNETPKRPSTLNSSVPPALDAVVMRALAKEPERRFRDADAFMKALDAAERAPNAVRPEDTAAFAAVGVDGATILEADEVYEERPEPRRRWGRWLLLALLVAGVAALVAYALTRPEQVQVPNVTGQSIGQATQVLENRGFDVDQTYVPNPAVRDTVLEQNPIASEISGKKVDEGSSVVLTVSQGPGNVAVPSVQGLSEREATKKLEGVGLLVEPDFAFSETVPKTRVIGTEPADGTEIETGSTVTLLISRGSNRVEVPSVVGLQEGAALDALDAVGLSGNVVERDSETAPQGEVVDQSPGGGRRVAQGTQVQIFVSSGTVQVPDTVGLARKDAVTTLKRAGFSVSVREDPTADPAEDGIVVDQFPPPGQRAREGDTVTIVVGNPPPEPEPPTDPTTVP